MTPPKPRAEASTTAAEVRPRVTDEAVMLTPLRAVSADSAARQGAALFRAHPGILSATYLVADRSGRQSRVRVERRQVAGGYVIRSVELAGTDEVPS